MIRSLIWSFMIVMKYAFLITSQYSNKKSTIWISYMPHRTYYKTSKYMTFTELIWNQCIEFLRHFYPEGLKLLKYWLLFSDVFLIHIIMAFLRQFKCRWTACDSLIFTTHIPTAQLHIPPVYSSITCDSFTPCHFNIFSNLRSVMTNLFGTNENIPTV